MSLRDVVGKYNSYHALHRRAAVLFFFLCLVFLYVVFVFLDQRKEEKNIREEIKTFEAILKQREKDAGSLEVLKVRLKDLEDHIEKQKVSLPDDASIAEFLQEVGEKGTSSGVVIKEFEPTFEKEVGYFSEINFSVHVYGSYHKIALFLDEILHLKRVVTLTNIWIGLPKQEGSEVVLSASLDVKTYRFIPDKKQEALP